MATSENTSIVRYFTGKTGSKAAHICSVKNPSAILGLWIDGAGAAGEFANGEIHTPGVAHLLEHVCVGRFFSIADKYGWQCDASTSFNAVQYHLLAPKADFERSFSCFFEFLSSPEKCLPNRAIEIKRAANELLKMMDTDPNTMFVYRTLHAVYRHPAFLNNYVGSEADILSIKNKDLLRFWTSRYKEDSVTFVVSINASPEVTKPVFKHLNMNEGQNANIVLNFHPSDYRWAKKREGVLFQLAYPVTISSDINESSNRRFIQNFIYREVDKAVRERTGNYGIIRDRHECAGFGRDAYNFIARPYDAEKLLECVCRSLERIARTGSPSALRSFLKRETTRPCSGVGQVIAFHQEILPQLPRYGHFLTDCERVSLINMVTKEGVRMEAQNILNGPLAFCAEGTLKGLPSRRQVAGIFGRKSLSL